MTERHPLAIGRIGEELYLVDEHGAIIDEFGPRYADLDLPILDGLATGTAGDADGRAARRPRGTAAGRRCGRSPSWRAASRRWTSPTRTTPS